MKPEYFIENMTEGSENHHKSLAPAMSTLIIIGHVKEGLELAEENNLPESLVQFIEQHHGTTLVEYFFHEATRKADEDSNRCRRIVVPLSWAQTTMSRNSSADAGRCRRKRQSNPEGTDSETNPVTGSRNHNEAFLDGQFDECDLKMAEIRMIEESLIKSLLAAHHGRVKYPDQRTA